MSNDWNDWNKKTLTLRFPLREVNLVAGGEKKLGCIMILEDDNSGKWNIHLHGRAGWFSSADPEMDMKIHASDIEQIKSLNQSIKILLKESKFNSVEIIFKNYEDKDKCYEVISNMIVNYKEGKEGRFIPDISSMDYSTIDNDIKEELAERVAMTVLKIENLCHVVEPHFVVDELLDVRRELIQVVNALGGHPAVPRIS